jgi:hypothetical protein
MCNVSTLYIAIVVCKYGLKIVSILKSKTFLKKEDLPVFLLFVISLLTCVIFLAGTLYDC